MCNETDKSWREKTLAYRLLGIGRKRRVLTPEEKKQRFKEAMDNGPVGVWIKILRLGPVGKAMWIALGIFGLVSLLFGRHIFPMP